MKRIRVRDGEFSTKAVLTLVVRTSNVGMDTDEMRRRVRILDALDCIGDDHFLLEDDDHKTLKDTIAQFRFAVADRNLLAVIDDVLEAKTITVAEVPFKEAAE